MKIIIYFMKMKKKIKNSIFLKWRTDYEKDIICYFAMWVYGYGFNWVHQRK